MDMTPSAFGPLPPTVVKRNREAAMARDPSPPPPASLEELLERQWSAGTAFVMNQAQHFDIASLLSCLARLQQENDALENHLRTLDARRASLVASNARLQLPLVPNGNPPGFMNGTPAFDGILGSGIFPGNLPGILNNFLAPQPPVNAQSQLAAAISSQLTAAQAERTGSAPEASRSGVVQGARQNNPSPGHEGGNRRKRDSSPRTEIGMINGNAGRNSYATGHPGQLGSQPGDLSSLNTMFQFPPGLLAPGMPREPVMPMTNGTPSFAGLLPSPAQAAGLGGRTAPGQAATAQMMAMAMAMGHVHTSNNSDNSPSMSQSNSSSGAKR